MENHDKETVDIKPQEWLKIHNLEKNLTIEERKAIQLEKLKSILESLAESFGQSSLIAATKIARGESADDREKTELEAHSEKDELVQRITGLKDAFGNDFYSQLEEITGKSFLPSQAKPEIAAAETASEVKAESVEEVEGEEESVRVSKLPKGFNKWDLKQIKLHESKPADNKRIWVEFWSLRGFSYVGEILYNANRDLFYFKPYDPSYSSFALTEEHGRKATREARNYYFKVSTPPKQERK